MKITMEVELDGRERTCVAIYGDSGTLLASCWIDETRIAPEVLEITKALLLPLIQRYGVLE